MPAFKGHVERLAATAGQLELHRAREELDVHVQTDVPQVRLHDLADRGAGARFEQ